MRSIRRLSLWSVRWWHFFCDFVHRANRVSCGADGHAHSSDLLIGNNGMFETVLTYHSSDLLIGMSQHGTEHIRLFPMLDASQDKSLCNQTTLYKLLHYRRWISLAAADPSNKLSTSGVNLDSWMPIGVSAIHLLRFYPLSTFAWELTILISDRALGRCNFYKQRHFPEVT